MLLANGIGIPHRISFFVNRSLGLTVDPKLTEWELFIDAYKLVCEIDRSAIANSIFCWLNSSVLSIPRIEKISLQIAL